MTESGVNLTDRDLGYAEARSLGCTGAPGSTLPFTLGACIDGKRELLRRAAAQAFFDLQSVTGGPPVTAVYWYQFAAAAGALGLGSAGLPWSGRGRVLRMDAAAVTACPGDAQAR